MLNESIPSKYQTHNVITLHHTTSTLLIQGSQRTVCVKEEFPLLQVVFNHGKDRTTSINEACNQVFQKSNNQNNNQQDNLQHLWHALIPQQYKEI